MKQKTIRQFTDTLIECNLLSGLLSRIFGQVNGRYLYAIKYNDEKNEISLTFSSGKLHKFYTKKLRYSEFESAITNYFEDFFLFTTISDFSRIKPKKTILDMPYKTVDRIEKISDENLPF